jgi:hypothetical protein
LISLGIPKLVRFAKIHPQTARYRTYGIIIPYSGRRRRAAFRRAESNARIARLRRDSLSKVVGPSRRRRLEGSTGSRDAHSPAVTPPCIHTAERCRSRRSICSKKGLTASVVECQKGPFHRAFSPLAFRPLSPRWPQCRGVWGQRRAASGREARGRRDRDR